MPEFIDKKEIKIYLAHYGSTRFFERQVNLIRKYIQYNIETTVLKIFGFVDSSNDETSADMRQKWLELDVTPLDLPRGRSHDFSQSYGMAFQYIYDNFIKYNTFISLFLENDIFPIDYINIEEYCKDYKICGEIRFDASKLPDRMIMFYLGIQIFNHEKMTDTEIYSGLKNYVTAVSGRRHEIDCGGESYYWLQKNENYKHIRHIPTIGNTKSYDPFVSPVCDVHNITTDIENLPELLREGYLPSFCVVNYNNMFLHLELMGHDYENNPLKLNKNIWFNTVYNKLMKR